MPLKQCPNGGECAKRKEEDPFRKTSWFREFTRFLCQRGSSRRPSGAIACGCRYPPYGEAQARELIDCLREIAPYVVIDCGSYIANDILSAVALMEADSVLRLANADLKSISYLSSQLPLLKDAKWDTDKQYKIAANVKPQQAGEQIGQALGNVAFILPHSEELEAQFLAGILLSDLTMKESRSFRKEIEQVCREVFSC